LAPGPSGWGRRTSPCTCRTKMEASTWRQIGALKKINFCCFLLFHFCNYKTLGCAGKKPTQEVNFSQDWQLTLWNKLSYMLR
jgi:hypothetical protein